MAAGGLNDLLHMVGNTSVHNPVEPYIASAWNYMTNNYSRFTISMWISVVLHEVRGSWYCSVLKLMGCYR